MRKEILEIKQKEVSMEAAGNKIASLRHKNITKKGARVFKEGLIYSSSFVGEVSDDALLQEALALEENALAFDYPLSVIDSISAANLLADQTAQDFTAEFQTALSFLNERFPEFIFSGKANLSRLKKEIRFLNEATLAYEYDYSEWYFIYKHKKSANMMDGFLGSSGVAQYNILSEVKLYDKFLQVGLSEVSLDDGLLPVVFVEPGPLFSKLKDTTRVDQYKKGLGLFKNKLGEIVLSEAFSLYDVSFDPQVNAVNLFDADGFVRAQKRLALIEKGVFQNLIVDSRNAAKYGLKPTGNTQRNFDSNSELGFNEVIVDPGERSTAEVLKGLDKCLVIEMAAGGEFTDLGDYSTPAQSGYLLEKGDVVGKLPQITLSSSVQKMFGSDLIEIANNPFSGLSKCPAIFMMMQVRKNS